MKSYAMATIAFAYLIISAIGIIASCVLLHNLLNLTVLIVIVIVSVLSTLEEEYITKTLTLITEKLEQSK